jgi:hypothetical protein
MHHLAANFEWIIECEQFGKITVVWGIWSCEHFEDIVEKYLFR